MASCEWIEDSKSGSMAGDSPAWPKCLADSESRSREVPVAIARVVGCRDSRTHQRPHPHSHLPTVVGSRLLPARTATASCRGFNDGALEACEDGHAGLRAIPVTALLRHPVSPPSTAVTNELCEVPLIPSGGCRPLFATCLSGNTESPGSKYQRCTASAPPIAYRPSPHESESSAPPGLPAPNLTECHPPALHTANRTQRF